MPEGYDLPEIFILTKIIEFWANPLFLSQIKILILFGSRRKLVIYVRKRRGFSRRFWLLIKELLIARDADRRNKNPYINVSFLEFDFLESHIFLEMFILTNKNHRLLDNPHSHQLWIWIVRKRNNTIFQMRLQSRWDRVFFLFSSISNLQISILIKKYLHSKIHYVIMIFVGEWKTFADEQLWRNWHTR